MRFTSYRHLIATISSAAAIAFAKKTDDAPAQMETLCGKFENLTTSPNGTYTYLTAQYNEDDSGSQCMTVAVEEELLKQSRSQVSFNATWAWTAMNEHGEPKVHTYPSVQLNSDLLPIQLQHIEEFSLEATWSMLPDSVPQHHWERKLSGIEAIADVAMDLFLNDDPDIAMNSSHPKFWNTSKEVMIWHAAYGSLIPIGWENVSTTDPPTVKLEDATYTLSRGINTGTGTEVYTWYPSTNISSISMDVAPLLNYLWRREYVSNATYLGLVQWGSETAHSAPGRNVTFSAQAISMAVAKGVPKSDFNGAPNILRGASRGAVALAAVCAATLLGFAL